MFDVHGSSSKTPVTYVIGHRNPDSDSVLSALSYAWLLNHLNPKETYIAAAAGPLNPQTRYIIEKFDTDPPEIITDITPKASHFSKEHLITIKEHEPLARALELYSIYKYKMLPVLDSSNKCLGILSLTDMFTAFLRPRKERQLRSVKTSVTSIKSTLKGRYLFDNKNVDHAAVQDYILHSPCVEFSAFEASMRHLSAEDWKRGIFVVGMYPEIIHYLIVKEAGVIVISKTTRVNLHATDDFSEDEGDDDKDLIGAVENVGGARPAGAETPDHTAGLQSDLGLSANSDRPIVQIDQSAPMTARSYQSVQSSILDTIGSSGAKAGASTSATAAASASAAVHATVSAAADAGAGAAGAAGAATTSTGTGSAASSSAGSARGAPSKAAGVSLSASSSNARLFSYDIFKTLSSSRTVVIVTNLAVASATLLVKQSTPVKFYVNRDKNFIVPDTTKLSDIKTKLTMSKTAHGVCVVEKSSEKLVGIITRTDFIKSHIANVILMDHNEPGQNVLGLKSDGIEVVEIVDHHRLGNDSTLKPIKTTVRTVGSTCTIVTGFYRQAGVVPPVNIAGLLLSGICSDTLILRSPTTTKVDKRCAEYLSQIVGKRVHDVGSDIFNATSPLTTTKDKIQLVRTDYKVYPLDGRPVKIGVAQVETTSLAIVTRDIIDELQAALKVVCKEDGLWSVCLLVTDVIYSNSILLVEGPTNISEVIGYPQYGSYEMIFEMNGVVSRKKQLLPHLMNVLPFAVS